MASETLADIVTDLREWADNHAAIGPSALRDIADRIDAAAKRERVEVEADALSAGGLVEAMRHKPSNAAAMREALEKATRMLSAWRRELPFKAWDEIGETLDKCNAALSAPPRNCDVPHKDDHELWLRWQAYCAEIYPSRMSFSTWLLDLAQEGAANA